MGAMGAGAEHSIIWPWLQLTGSWPALCMPMLGASGGGTLDQSLMLLGARDSSAADLHAWWPHVCSVSGGAATMHTPYDALWLPQGQHDMQACQRLPASCAWRCTRSRARPLQSIAQLQKLQDES